MCNCITARCLFDSQGNWNQTNWTKHTSDSRVFGIEMRGSEWLKSIKWRIGSWISNWLDFTLVSLNYTDFPCTRSKTPDFFRQITRTLVIGNFLFAYSISRFIYSPFLLKKREKTQRLWPRIGLFNATYSLVNWRDADDDWNKIHSAWTKE